MTRGREKRVRAGSMPVRIISLSAMIFLLIVIFILSGQPGEESTVLSNGIASRLGIVESEDDLAISAAPVFAGLSVRKIAHIFLYSLLGLATAVHVISLEPDRKPAATMVIVLFLGVIFAGADEIHQLFVDGRAGMIQDVFIDMIGYGAASCALCIGRWVHDQRH